MKSKHLYIIAALFFSVITVSCEKPNTEFTLVGGGDKDKIDLKGSMTNGDMRHLTVEAVYWEKMVYLYFYDYLGVCRVSLFDTDGNMVFSELHPTYPDTEVRCFMGDQPLGRYHLIITNEEDRAEGWFNNFKIKAIKLQ